MIICVHVVYVCALLNAIKACSRMWPDLCATTHCLAGSGGFRTTFFGLIQASTM